MSNAARRSVAGVTSLLNVWRTAPSAINATNEVPSAVAPAMSGDAVHRADFTSASSYHAPLRSSGDIDGCRRCSRLQRFTVRNSGSSVINVCLRLTQPRRAQGSQRLSAYSERECRQLVLPTTLPSISGSQHLPIHQIVAVNRSCTQASNCSL